jgi:hypothetical protein
MVEGRREGGRRGQFSRGACSHHKRRRTALICMQEPVKVETTTTTTTKLRDEFISRRGEKKKQ